MVAREFLRSTGPRDAALLASSILMATLGVAFGWQAAGVAVAVAALPAVGFLVAGHVPGRAGASGCLAIGLGATLIRPMAGALPWGDLALLAGMATVACLGASQARKLARARGLEVSTPEGRWVSIVVECENPSDSAGQVSRPKVSPHPMPERRGLTRLAGDRRRGRRPALAR